MGFFDEMRSFFRGADPSPGDAASEEARGGTVGCEEALEHLYEYLDGELEPVTEEQVAEHFRVCQRCFPRLGFEKAFQQALRRVRAGEEPPAALRRRVLELLREEGFGGS